MGWLGAYLETTSPSHSPGFVQPYLVGPAKFTFNLGVFSGDFQDGLLVY
jgi:hypothetical protein